MPESLIHYIEVESGEALALQPAPAIGLSSATAGWQGIAVEQWRLPPMELPESFATQHLVTIKLAPPGMLEWAEGTGFRSALFGPGDVCITPAGAARRLRWHEQTEILAVALAPARLAEVGAEVNGSQHIELIQTHARRDPQVQFIGMALQAELADGCPGGRLYAEALTTALAAHLVAAHNAFRSATPDWRGGLAPTQLRRALDYIETNLDRDLTLTEIALALDMSVSRLKAQFKQSTGQAPHQYVIQRRVERARELLLRGRTTPAEAAVRVGFYDQSHLTRHFRRLLGITPGALLKRK